MSSPSQHLTPGLSDREACIDAFYRLIEGIDDNDMSLVRSACSPSLIVLRPEVAKGVPRPPLNGLEAFIENITCGIAGTMDTLHMMSNLRVRVQGNTARLTAYGLCTHYVLGEGFDQEVHGCHIGTRFTADLEKQHVEGIGSAWLIEKLVLKVQWIEGDVATFVRAADKAQQRG